jgi:hypothetical protein
MKSEKVSHKLGKTLTTYTIETGLVSKIYLKFSGNQREWDKLVENGWNTYTYSIDEIQWPRSERKDPSQSL